MATLVKKAVKKVKAGAKSFMKKNSGDAKPMKAMPKSKMSAMKKKLSTKKVPTKKIFAKKLSK